MENMNEQNKTIYVVFTQTGAMLSRILKVVTRARYNHSSISLTDSLSPMYSFGRIRPKNPFWGGFVMEAPRFGTFLRFPQTDAVVISVNVTDKQYEEIKSHLNDMYENKDNYGYNYLGLALGLFGKGCQLKNRYYCSEFVKDVLVRFDIVSDDVFMEVVKPIDILNALDGEIVYKGKLKDFTVQACS